MKRLIRLTVLSGMLLAIAAADGAAPVPPPAPPPARFREIAYLKGTSFATCVAFSPDSKRLAVANQSREGVQVWDVASRKVVLVLRHRDAGRAQFSPDGKIVATASQHVKLWDAAGGKELAKFNFVAANALVFSPDSKKLAAVARGIVRIFSIAEKKELRSYDIDVPRRLISGYPSIKKPVFAIPCGKDRPIALIDVFAGKQVVACENRFEEAEHFAGDREEKILAAFCWGPRGGRQPGVFGPTRPLIRQEIVLWDRDKGKKIGSVNPVLGSGHRLVLSPDGKVLAVLSDVLRRRGGFLTMEDSGLRFHEVPSGRLLHFQETGPGGRRSDWQADGMNIEKPTLRGGYSMFAWIRKVWKEHMALPPKPASSRRRVIPMLEQLEDRMLLSSGAPLMVTNLSGDPTVVGSLPYEVSIAKTGQTIDFKAGLQGTIPLTSAIELGKNGVTDLTIDGTGGVGLVITISGQNQSRIFTVDPNTSVRARPRISSNSTTVHRAA